METPIASPETLGKLAKARKASKSNVPQGDSDFDTTLGRVSVKWEASPQITLIWKTAADFKTDVTAFSTTLGSRKEAGSDRPGITSDLKIVNEKLDLGIEYVKRYLAGDFGKTASAQYSKFGIEKKGSGYKLPLDRDKRRRALPLIVPALTAMGFEAKEYGKAYFEPLIASFLTLSGQASTTDSGVSGLVGNKNAAKTELRLVLTCLIKNLQSNYPQTWKSVLREWGFQKEKY